jgi:glycosyltransferase involved in cell wall biosynthesis
VRFCSIGQDFASPFNSVFPGRGIAIPFAALETYPAAMMSFDIAIAPALDSAFQRGKSPLRAMEAGALGIPIVADRALYQSVVKDNKTGFLVDTPAQAEAAIELLASDESLRLRMGDAARAHITSNYDMRLVVEHWRAALQEAFLVHDAVA